jgi:hypothetical protein
MYQRSDTEKQKGLWTSADRQLGERSRKMYDAPSGWHNQFRQQITNRIDEDIFKPLFSETMGAANAPIRVLAAMMALKEGTGISDERLYDEGRYNLKTRSALGLVNIDEEIPVESTYYLFRKRIVEHEEATGKNLLEDAFDKITKGQCLEFGVSGKRVRMDSKLMGSNLAWYTRYEIVHETIKMYCKSLIVKPNKLNERESKLLEEIMGEAGGNVSYRSTKEELAARMEALGWLMYWLMKEPTAESEPDYALLKRVFDEQYVLAEGPGGGKEKKVKARDKTELPAPLTVVANPHDPDAEFRTKNGKTITGYSVNVTETCDNDTLNLIMDIQVKGAGASDQSYFKEAIHSAQSKVTEKVQEVYTDGGFHSVDNQEYCKKEEIDWTLRGISGKPSKYGLSYNENGDLVVFNTETKQTMPSKRAKTRDPAAPERWVIKDGDHAPIYFEDKDVVVCELRKKIAALPKEKLDIRNNVEATIFQLGYHYRGNKSRYRGLIKHRLWAISRSLWINFRRITAWFGKKEAETAAYTGQLLKSFRLYFYKPHFSPQLVY